MMRNLIPPLALSTLLYCLPAHAIPITDTVTADDNEWAQADLFGGLSWNDINAVCPDGVCGSGSLNGYDMSGWTWASSDDVNALFNSYIGNDQLGPGPDSYHEVGSLWAPAFFGAGWRPNVVGFGEEPYDIIAVAGFTNACEIASSCLNRAYLWWSVGAPGTVDTANTASASDGINVGLGAWFSRSAAVEVPVPATLVLFGLGLAGLGYSGRRKS